MEFFKIIAFTHKNLSLEEIGKLHLSEEVQKECLPAIVKECFCDELMYLSTCNRVEVLICSNLPISPSIVISVARSLNPRQTPSEAKRLAQRAEVYQGEDAVKHLLSVASSIESMVVGEREIITQVRKAYETCNKLRLTGDFLRLLIRQTIETAKEIYTTTDIAKNPVSVASLAYRQLRDLGVKNSARIVFVGSGETNTTLAGYFQKHQIANFTVFNRTLKNGKKLAKRLNGRAFTLKSINKYSEGFDVLVVCTSSDKPVISEKVYQTLLNKETSKKIIIDLGLPANVEEKVAKSKQIKYINISSLKAQAEVNMQLRRTEMAKCEEIIKAKAKAFNILQQERQIELAFGEIPIKIKEIKNLALTEVFIKEISQLDSQSKEVLDKILLYMEKKYNAVAIKTAKEVFRSPDRGLV